MVDLLQGVRLRFGRGTHRGRIQHHVRMADLNGGDGPTQTATMYAAPVPLPWAPGPAPPYRSARHRTAGQLQVLCSLFGVPGLGRVWLGDLTTAAAMAILYCFGLSLLIFGVGLPIVFGAWIWSVADGLILMGGPQLR